MLKKNLLLFSLALLLQARSLYADSEPTMNTNLVTQTQSQPSLEILWDSFDKTLSEAKTASMELDKALTSAQTALTTQGLQMNELQSHLQHSKLLAENLGNLIDDQSEYTKRINNQNKVLKWTAGVGIPVGIVTGIIVGMLIR